MNQEELFTFRDSLENLLAKHSSLLGNEPDMLKREFSVDSTEKMRAIIDEKREAGRLLKLGIVGRVKAGKSSLLNALIFKGQDVLPKAATPMTAALTQLSYGETLSAEVEFFTDEDIRRIKAEHDRYEEDLNRLKSEKFEELKYKRLEKKKRESGSGLISKLKEAKEKIMLSSQDEAELKEKAEKNAIRELHENPALEASFDQYERIKNSGVTCPQQRIIQNADTIEELSAILAEYVGANGKYMPFTKSVEIHYPAEELKDLLIVDTPGINDPVQSREERTRELLKNCDVIFIVSPSGQFLSFEDTKLLDRIVAKEGINYIYVIASQIDTQLFGSEKEASKQNLNTALANIAAKLDKQLTGTVNDLINNVGGMESLRSLTDGGNKSKLTYSSGVSQSLLLNFDKQDLWDENAKTVWENLKEHYGLYFSDEDRNTSMNSLALLANTGKIKNIIHGVRENKNAILEKAVSDFIEKKSENLLKFRDELLKSAKEQVGKINETDLNELKKQQKNIAKIKEKATIAITEDYAEILDELKIKLKDELEKTVDNPFKELKKTVEGANKEETDSYPTYRHDWGFIRWGKEYHTYHYTELNAGAVYEGLKDTTDFLKTCVSDKKDEFMFAWRKNLYGRMFNTLRSKVNDEDIDLDIVRKVFRQLVSSIDFSKLIYSGEIPESLKQHTRLRDSARDEYLRECEEYISSLKRRVKKDIRGFVDELIEKLGKQDPASELFKGYEKQMEELENMINNKAVTLAEFKKFTDELAKL